MTLQEAFLPFLHPQVTFLHPQVTFLHPQVTFLHPQVAYVVISVNELHHSNVVISLFEKERLNISLE